eukprot:gene15218-14743_t
MGNKAMKERLDRAGTTKMLALERCELSNWEKLVKRLEPIPAGGAAAALGHRRVVRDGAPGARAGMSGGWPARRWSAPHAACATA